LPVTSNALLSVIPVLVLSSAVLLDALLFKFIEPFELVRLESAVKSNMAVLVAVGKIRIVPPFNDGPSASGEAAMRVPA